MEEKNTISLLDYLGVLIRYRWIIISVTAIAFILSVVISLIQPQVYTAKTTILPNKGQEDSRLSALSNIPGITSNLNFPFMTYSSSELYPDIIVSREILKPVLHKKFTVDNDSTSKKLITILFGSDKNDYFYREECLNKFRNKINVSRNRSSGIITIEVSCKDRYLAAEIANALTERLDYYNRVTRISKAKENRIFVEERMKEAKDSLNVAENRYKEFREGNVAFDLSPRLKVEEARLLRDIEIKQEAYTSLTNQYYLSLIEEQKDIPIVNVLEKAVPPLLRTSPKRTFMVIVSVIIGVLAGIVAAYSIDFYKRTKTEFQKNEKYQFYYDLLSRDMVKIRKLLKKTGVKKEDTSTDKAE